MELKGLHFADVAEIQEAGNDELQKVPKKRNFRQFHVKLYHRTEVFI